MEPMLSRKEFLASLGALLLSGWGCGDDENDTGGNQPGGNAGASPAPGAGQGGQQQPPSSPTAGGTGSMQNPGGNAGMSGASGTGAAPVVDAGGTPAQDAGSQAQTDAGGQTDDAAVVDAGGGSTDAGTDAAAEDAGSSVCVGDVMATSSGTGHTHSVMIPLAAIMAGGTQQFETSRDLGHTHWIELVDADFAMLRSGGTVTKTTCSGGDHIYELRCGEDLTATELPQDCNDECGNAQNNICS